MRLGVGGALGGKLDKFGTIFDEGLVFQHLSERRARVSLSIH
jgi:hypothetical protein